MPAASSAATSQAACAGRVLLPALRALAALAPSPILGLVYGAGFEDRPELLTLIAKHWPLLGNDAATVARLKAPESFFAELDRLGIPHPATTQRTAREGAQAGSPSARAAPAAVISRRAGCNATRARSTTRSASTGRAVSALFVANGRRARVLGFSEQWTAPTPRSPFRYGGALRPASLRQSVAREMASAVAAIARSFAVVGLASADFLVEGDDALLLEINPRPGATLDIFDSGAKPLMRLHLEAIREGRLPRSGLKFDDAMASAIVYSPCRVSRAVRHGVARLVRRPT